MNNARVLKSIEAAGQRIELVCEKGEPLKDAPGVYFVNYRVNLKDESGYETTRVFDNRTDASNLFDAYANGN